MEQAVLAHSYEHLSTELRLNDEAGKRLLEWYGARQIRPSLQYAMWHYADHTTPSFERINTMGEKIEAVGTPSSIIPELTVCIPVAEEAESQRSITRTMDQIAKAQRNFGRPIQVIAWSNRIGENAARQENPAYHEIVRLVTPYSNPELSILTAHDDITALPHLSQPMSVVRQHMMEGLLARALENNYTIRHPVLWLDADTTFVGKNTFSQIITNVTPQDIGVFRPSLDYSVDWLNGDIANFDPATKAFVVDELARRKFFKRASAIEIEEQYIQECGSYFSLATYLMAGGINVRAYENAGLLLNLEKIKDNWFAEQMKEDYQEAIGQPLNLDTFYGISTPEVQIATSGRRYHAETTRRGNSGLIEQRAHSVEGERYMTHVSKEHLTETAGVPIEPLRFLKEVYQRYDAYLEAKEMIALLSLMRQYFPKQREEFDIIQERLTQPQAAQ